MLLPLIGSAAAGGLIGYGTNWLAIRMLFWPLEERRLLGWRIPFTPGLIPKKRGKLAAALGDTVASYLVTPATLEHALAAPEFRQQLAEFLQAAWARLRRDDCTIEELLREHDLFAPVDQMAERAALTLLQALQRDGGQRVLQRATQAIGPAFRVVLIERLGSAVGQSDLIGDQTALRTPSENAEWRTALVQVVSDALLACQRCPTPLGLLFPSELQASLHQLVLAKGPDWLDQLQEMLRSDHSRIVIKRLIKDFLAGNPMLKLLAAFADLDRIADSLPGLLSKEEVRTELTAWALSALDQAWHLPASQVSSALLPPSVTPDNLHAWVEGQVSEERLTALQHFLGERLQSVDWSALWQPLKPLLRALWHAALADPGVQVAIGELLKESMAQVLTLPTHRCLPEFPPERFAVWSEQISHWLSQMVTRHGQALLAALRLPQVVEAQVNGLEIAQVEEILLRVMREQLRAITNLGFLLGAVVGMILPSLNAWLASL